MGSHSWTWLRDWTKSQWRFLHEPALGQGTEGSAHFPCTWCQLWWFRCWGLLTYLVSLERSTPPPPPPPPPPTHTHQPLTLRASLEPLSPQLTASAWTTVCLASLVAAPLPGTLHSVAWKGPQKRGHGPQYQYFVWMGTLLEYHGSWQNSILLVCLSPAWPALPRAGGQRSVNPRLWPWSSRCSELCPKSCPLDPGAGLPV